MNYLITVLVFVGLGACTYFGPNLKEHFGTRYENADRKIFENNISHVRGTIKNLSRLRLEYKTTQDEAHKTALKEMILTESAAFDLNKLPYDLQQFIRSL